MPTNNTEMEEKNLIKVALIISLTGILLLFLISENVSIKYYPINEISEKLLNREVTVKGVITRITETPGLLILNIKDLTGEMTSITFREGPINLTENQEIPIQGKALKYKNQLKIEADKITLLQ
jgi:RecJ-like exonuclease